MTATVLNLINADPYPTASTKATPGYQESSTRLEESAPVGNPTGPGVHEEVPPSTRKGTLNPGSQIRRIAAAVTMWNFLCCTLPNAVPGTGRVVTSASNSGDHSLPRKVKCEKQPHHQHQPTRPLRPRAQLRPQCSSRQESKTPARRIQKLTYVLGGLACQTSRLSFQECCSASWPAWRSSS